MMGTRLGSSLVAVCAGLLLTSSVQAAPTTSDQTFPALKMRLAVPRFLAREPARLEPANPPLVRPRQRPPIHPRPPGRIRSPRQAGTRLHRDTRPTRILPRPIQCPTTILQRLRSPRCARRTWNTSRTSPSRLDIAWQAASARDW